MNMVRDWLKRRTSKPAPAQPTHTSQTDLGARTNRTDHINELQATVARLQQERLTLSNANDGQSGTESPRAADQMAALERELDTAQRELGKIQGRI